MSETRPGRTPRDRLILPLAAIITLVWVAAAAVALTTGDAVMFEISSGPFALMSGYVFGISITRSNGASAR